MILVTGSTGRVGREVTFGLVREDIALRAMIHHGTGAEWIHWSNVDTVMGEFADPHSLDAALSGIDAVFLTSSISAKQTELQTAMIDACARAGVKHVVYLSLLGAAAAAPSRLLQRHAATESYLARAGVRYTVLRANLYLTTILEQQRTIAEESTIVSSLDKGTAISMLAPRDVAAVACAKLLAMPAEDAILELTGAEPLRQTDIAAELTRRLERTIGYRRVAPEDFIAMQRAAGLPRENAESIAELYAWYDGGEAARVTDAVERATGVPPLSLRAYLDTTRRKLA
ncbi:MAG: NAD(P)H-binding protein [Candidatus Velthaea sp.]